MIYIKVTDGNPTPYSIEQLRRDYPSHGFSDQPSAETLAAFNVYECAPAGDAPEVDTRSQRALRGYEQTSGVWSEVWRVVDIPQEEQVAQLDAARRSARLSRYDLAVRVARLGMITFEEAADWAAGNAIPEIMLSFVSGLPDDIRGPALVDIKASHMISRVSPHIIALGQLFGLSDDQIDGLFGVSV